VSPTPPYPVSQEAFDSIRDYLLSGVEAVYQAYRPDLNEPAARAFEVCRVGIKRTTLEEYRRAF
jgi:hypothetical protein